MKSSLLGESRVGVTLGLVLLTTVLCGCGGNENLASVTGTITLDGKPLPNAFVVFVPSAEVGGTTSYGRTDENGHYEMMFSDDEKGAWIGLNRVEISTGDVGAQEEGGAREKVPSVYNQETTLTADVKPGAQKFDFDLKSDAGKVVDLPSEDE